MQVLGYAAYAWVTAGFASFGPVFLQGLVRQLHLRAAVCVRMIARCATQKLFKSQNAASLSFGAMVALAGFIGTAVGGLLLDKLQVKDWTATVARYRARRCLQEPADDLLPANVAGSSATDAAADEALTVGPDGEASQMLLDSKLCASMLFSACGIFIGFLFCLLSPLVASSL
jgi:hypothetical protein